MSTDFARKDPISRRARTASMYCTIACCFFIPFSSSLMGLTAVAALVFWIFSGQYKNKFAIIKSSPPALLALSLFGLLAFSISYGTVPPLEAMTVLKKYRELLYFLIPLTLFQDNEKGVRSGVTAFICGCSLLMLLSYAMYFSIIPMEKYGYSTVHHITHSFFMAVLAFFSLQRGFIPGKYRYLYFGIAALASINLFYIAPGRTGMLVFIGLALITFFQKLSLQKSLVACVVACSLIAGLFLTSDNFASRIKLAITEIEDYQPDAQESRSSMGMRFDWWQNSIDIIREKPLLGHGVGSFAHIQGRLIEGSSTKPTDNPHNEYLLLTAQVGLVGTALFIGWLATIFFTSFTLDPKTRHPVQYVVVAMATGCLMNSFLFDSHQGHFFAVIAGLLCAGQRAAGADRTKEQD
jgi:O-antigen ligase